MFNFCEVTPQRYPTNLINKDWSQRSIKYYSEYLHFVKKVHELEVFDDDVWLVTLPKSGTTWMQELLWLVVNNFDFETAKKEHLEVRTPCLEFDYIIHENLERAFKPLESLSRPRLIKTHLCLPLLPAQIWDKKPKVIYVSRNIQDAYVSLYYQYRSLGFSMDKTLEQFVATAMKGDKLFDPFLHITEFFSLRNEHWLYYTSFESMKHDLRQVITEVCTFLNKTITEETMEKMLKHLSFEEMKNNAKTNHIWDFEQVRKKMGLPYEHHNFVRKGQVNGYKDELSPEMVSKLNNWVTENLSKYNVTMEELLLLK
ncbi:sulfotransferase 1E1-like [Calliphora vicina]|uniref:sulfotransferase 1E1-like n=1 Tax=Calliphora vicina TaxID=7373 RepID=UPI00325A8C79